MYGLKNLYSRIVLLATVCITVLVACGPDDAPSNDKPLDSALFEGIYEVDSWTRNTTGCDVEGDCIAHQRDPYLLVNVIKPVGPRVLQAWSCADLDSCRERSHTNSITLPQKFGPWDYRNDGDEIGGWREVNTGWVAWAGDTCETTVRDSTFNVIELGETIELRRVTYEVTLPARDGVEQIFDACPSEDLIAAAEESPCSGFKVVRASFLEPLP